MSSHFNVRRLTDMFCTSGDSQEQDGEMGRFDRRLRREFLRRLALGTVAIPMVGAASQAADKKTKKAKEAVAHSSAKQTTFQSGTVRSESPFSSSASGSPGGGATPDVSGQGAAFPEPYKHATIDNFQQIQTDEDAHTVFLVNALGSNARPMPTFQDLEMSTVEEFVKTARTLENTGVGAYLGALPILASTAAGQQYIPAAGSIALIEARHAGWINTVLNLSLDENIAGNVASFDVPLTPQQVVNIASPFFASLNGGPPLIPAGGLSNPIDVLNFALALEFLEAEFYNINVPNLVKTLAK